MKPKPCGHELLVQTYGGGTRYHCPKCDVREPAHGILCAYWTNGPAPADRKCTNLKPQSRS